MLVSQRYAINDCKVDLGQWTITLNVTVSIVSTIVSHDDVLHAVQKILILLFMEATLSAHVWVTNIHIPFASLRPVGQLCFNGQSTHLKSTGNYGVYS